MTHASDHPAPVSAVTATGSASHADADPASTPEGQYALATYFNHNRALFLRYHTLSCAQFARDLPLIEHAMSQQDWAQVRQLVHGVKPILALIGYEHYSADAQLLELAARQEDAAAAAQVWPKLRAHLRQLGSV